MIGFIFGFIAGGFAGPFVWAQIKKIWDRFEQFPPDSGSDDDNHA